MDFAITFAQILVVAAVLALTLKYGNRKLVAHYDDRPHLTFRRQIIQISGALLTVLLLILLMPFDATLRGQLLSFFGLVVSATIALSSTTLVGNAMAGIMLKTIGNCRPGNYITVGEHFGRISEMDLLHTEIQTEERDLTTLPNLYLATNPVRVMRDSGTLLFVELSLGYDVSRHLIEELLVKAAQDCELESPFVQIRDLGDFSVTYRVSGLLKTVNRLLDKRRELRRRTMDALHGEGIEIVSPTFMNTRGLSKAHTSIPTVDDVEGEESDREILAQSTDALVFDKAEKAESVERLRDRVTNIDSQLKEEQEIVTAAESDQAIADATLEIARLEARRTRIEAMIERKEANMSST